MICPHFEAIDEYLAIGVPPSLLPGQHRHHLEGCAYCQTSLEESLELARLLEEPLVLPPPDLTSRILQAVSTPPPVAPRRAVAQERFLWAALGAAAATLVPLLDSWDPLPWAQTAAALLPSWPLALPGLDPGWALAGAAALLAAQASVVWSIRRTEEAA